MIRLLKKIRSAEYADKIAVVLIILSAAVFFHKSIVYGKIPAPTDALVGLYHPFRDDRAKEYPNGLPYKNFLITDPIRQQIPWRKTVVNSVRNGRWPSWNNMSFSGTPLAANIQSGAFYPLNVAFFLLPFPAAWTMLIISQIVCAGLFFYFFMRITGNRPLPSYFGSVVFAYSGSSISWLTWGTILSSWMWTPLELACIYMIFTGNSRSRINWSVALAVSYMCSFFAGHIQIFFYSVSVTVLYAFWLARENKKVRLFPVFVWICAAVVLAVSFQLIPWFKWLLLTGRIGGSDWHAEGFFIPLYHLVQFLAPDFFGNPSTLNYWGVWNYGELTGYIGMSGIIFALAGIHRHTRFWWMLLIISLLLSVRSPISMIPYVLHIPFLSSLQPTRLLFVTDICLSILAVSGLTSLVSGFRKKAFNPVLLITGVLITVLWAVGFLHTLFGISPENAAVIQRNLFLPSVFYAGFMVLYLCLRIPRLSVRFAVYAALVLLTTVDLFRFGWKFTPFTDVSLFFPETQILSYLRSAAKPFRIMTTDDRILPPDTNAYYGIESIGGYDPLHSLRYEQLVAAMERGTPDITPPYGLDRILVPKNYLSPIYNLLNVRYILTFSDLTDRRFRLVMTEGVTKLYEDTQALGRTWLATNAIFRVSASDIVRTLYSKEFRYTRDAVVEYPVDILDLEPEAGEYSQLIRYDAGHMSVRVKAVQPRLLVLNESYNSGWHASVDGAIAPIIRTNYVFMGVKIPPGEHTVTFSYR